MAERGRNTSAREPYRVRLPKFITDEEVGLGDAIKRLTSTAGIRPCGACQKRAEGLNRRVTFGPSRRNPRT